MKGRLNWWIPPLLAVQFLTRIPLPGLNDLTPDAVQQGLQKSVRWFPAVGGLVGAITAATLIVADQLWPRAIAVILALILEARLTGAFHEDAVADYCDGFGGGQTSEHIIEIMKDSRIGSYGTLGLILAVGLRAACLMFIPGTFLVAALIASAAAGRWGAVLAMALIPPINQNKGIAKDIGKQVGGIDLVFATLLLVPFVAVFWQAAPPIAGAALIAQASAFIWFRATILKWLGGITGDCLGFFVYSSQLIWLLAALTWVN